MIETILDTFSYVWLFLLFATGRLLIYLRKLSPEVFARQVSLFNIGVIASGINLIFNLLRQTQIDIPLVINNLDPVIYVVYLSYFFWIVWRETAPDYKDTIDSKFILLMLIFSLVIGFGVLYIFTDGVIQFYVYQATLIFFSFLGIISLSFAMVNKYQNGELQLDMLWLIGVGITIVGLVMYPTFLFYTDSFFFSIVTLYVGLTLLLLSYLVRFYHEKSE